MRINHRQILIYPFLLAIYPLLNLYVTNANRIPFLDLATILVPIFGAILVLYLIAYRALKASTSAGILTTAIAVAVLYYGALYDVIGTLGTIGDFVQRYQYVLLLPGWIILFLLVGALVVRRRVTFPRVNEYLNFLSAVLIGILLFRWGMSQAPSIVNNSSSVQAANHAQDDSRSAPTRGHRSLNGRIQLDTLPDVYYIILDAYGRADVLRDYYNFDNSAFLDDLTSKGFYIATESHSNYPQTAMSIPSSLNVDYLDALGILKDGLSEEEKFFKSLSLISQSENYVARQFRDLGYTTIRLGSSNPLVNDEFFPQFFNLTIGKAIVPTYNMRVRRQNLLEIFDRLKEVPKIEGPTFTFAHVLAPHPPFVFDREGNFTGATGYNPHNVWLPPQDYTNQLLFINRMTEEVIDSILAQSETPPIIIIQGDHGPVSSWWRSRESLSILNAYYLPGNGDQYLYPSITPVNSFRQIFDLYFGTDLGLLEDRSYMVGNLSAYDLLCQSDNIFPGATPVNIWAANATKTLEENAFHLPIEDTCSVEKFFLRNEGFFHVEGTPGQYFRWAGPSLNLQFPVEANQDYIFRAQVIHHLSDENEEVRLLIDDELVASTSVTPGPFNEIEFIVPAEKIHTEPFVKVRIEHGYSSIVGKDRRELSLAYYWIEWMPLREFVSGRSLPANSPLLSVDSSLMGIVAADGALRTPPWGIEVYGDDSLLWLGQGEAEGIAGALWSTERQRVQTIFKVEPGPGRPDSQRTVEVVLENDAGIQTARRQFDQQTELIFAGELHPGRNNFKFFVLDEATIFEQPNGDTRPLLVLLHHITVSTGLGEVQAGPADHPLITVAPSLSGRVGIIPQLQSPPWGIEIYDNDSLLWLGHGETKGLSGTLWVTETQVIQAVFEVEPGPARPDSQRTVELTLENQAGVQRARRQFDQATKLTFINELQPGRNSFQFIVLDDATILKQPNGDTRPLLVLLRHVRVAPLSEP